MATEEKMPTRPLHSWRCALSIEPDEANCVSPTARRPLATSVGGVGDSIRNEPRVRGWRTPTPVYPLRDTVAQIAGSLALCIGYRVLWAQNPIAKRYPAFRNVRSTRRLGRHGVSIAAQHCAHALEFEVSAASGKVPVHGDIPYTSSATGQQALQTLAPKAKQVDDTVKVATHGWHSFTRHWAELVSGFLIGLAAAYELDRKMGRQVAHRWTRCRIR